MLLLVAHPALNWVLRGVRSAAAMVWMTFWPLVLGFSLSGCVQAFVSRDGLRDSLGTRRPSSVARASLLGVVSSSCSYAASAMARAVFARGATFSNSMIFMVASTNLVIELGIVIYLLLGWQFLVAELVGGVIMIVILAILLPRVFRTRRQEQLLERVRRDIALTDTTSTPASARTLDGWSRAARFAAGDLSMLRWELVVGFLVAGFLAADAPRALWRAVFLTGHGPWTLVENVLVAPLVAVVSFVCSVGNIPLAAALWSRGVAFGGVVAFIFADLITLPLLFIYRRFYGARATWRLFVVLWLTMATAGLVVDLAFRSVGALPTSRPTVVVAGTFALGSTLVLNIGAIVVVALGTWLVRRRVVDDEVAIDPVCGMQVVRATAAAVAVHDGATYYFCAPRCAERFLAAPGRFLGSPAPLSESIQLTRKPDHA